MQCNCLVAKEFCFMSNNNTYDEYVIVTSRQNLARSIIVVDSPFFRSRTPYTNPLRTTLFEKERAREHLTQ